MVEEKTKIKFCITGNQENPKGNAIPYLRMTQRSLWTPGARRYEAWKNFVREEYYFKSPKLLAALIGYSDYLPPTMKKAEFTPDYPFRFHQTKCRMDIMIYFKNKAHADCDNIWKGIADALFENDKLVAGSFDFKYADAGRVEVEITIF